jgi:hypothetical protein
MIAVRSARQPRSFRYPFAYAERDFMIGQLVKDLNPPMEDRLRIVPLVNLHYNDEQWVKDAQLAVYDQIEQGESVAFIGHGKDSSSSYLNIFHAGSYVHCTCTTRARSAAVSTYHLAATSGIGLSKSGLDPKHCDLIVNISRWSTRLRGLHDPPSITAVSPGSFVQQNFPL